MTGCTVQDDGTVQVQVNDQSESAAGLIGADGIHSKVRRTLWGDQHPTFTGNVAWRIFGAGFEVAKGYGAPHVATWWGPGSILCLLCAWRRLCELRLRGGEVWLAS